MIEAPRDSVLRAASHSERGRTRNQVAEGLAPWFLPLLWLALAVLGWQAFMGWQMWAEREQLAAARQNQEGPMANAVKLRTALDTLAADTQRMADAGNGNARVLVDELRRRGITINAAATAASAPP